MKRLLLVFLFSWIAQGASLCPWITGTLAPNYRDLIKRQPNRVELLNREAVRQVLRLRPSDCGRESGETKAQEAFRVAVEAHSGKIGAILPLTGRDAAKGRAMRKGMETAMGAALAGRLIVKDSASSPWVAERQLAELLFKDNVAIVLAGGSRTELDRLVPWADGLLMPLLILSSDKVSLDGARFAFRVFPSEKRLGMALAAAAQQRGLKRLAVLRPDEGQSDRLIKHFQDEAKKRGLEIRPAVFYRSGDAASLDQAVRTLYQIDSKARAEEFDKMREDGEKKAKERGLAFDPRTVFLKPVIEVDGILVPDHFRTLRHLTKILAYHGVPRTPLFGSQSWRSSALLEPPDPMLTGSVFADFMGSYDALPEGIRVPGDGFFAEPSQATDADFGAVGFRAARIADSAITSGETRRKLPETLSRLSDLDSGLYGMGAVFNDSHETRWPVFLFTIGTDKLEVMPMLMP